MSADRIFVQLIFREAEEMNIEAGIEDIDMSLIASRVQNIRHPDLLT